MTAWRFVTQNISSTEEHSRKDFKKTLDLCYKTIGDGGENRRQAIMEQITSGIFLTPTFRFTHTHK